MRTKDQIKAMIHNVILANRRWLDSPPKPATNGGLFQEVVKAQLDVLYWTINENRPKFKCDEKPVIKERTREEQILEEIL